MSEVYSLQFFAKAMAAREPCCGKALLPDVETVEEEIIVRCGCGAGHQFLLSYLRNEWKSLGIEHEGSFNDR
jgi:hypothetical protein